MTTNPAKPFPASGNSATCFAENMSAMRQRGITADVFDVQELMNQQIGVEMPLQGVNCTHCGGDEVSIIGCLLASDEIPPSTISH